MAAEELKPQLKRKVIPPKGTNISKNDKEFVLSRAKALQPFSII